jgi:hypothetical protein
VTRAVMVAEHAHLWGRRTVLQIFGHAAATVSLAMRIRL